MRMLMAVDLEAEDAAPFVRAASRWPASVGAIVDLLFVNEATDAQPYVLDPHLRQLVRTQYANYHDEMTRRLTELLPELPEAIRGHAICVRGRAVPQILERIDAYDGVVLGHRPLTGLARLAVGMVGERVTRGCRHKTVILVPR